MDKHATIVILELERRVEFARTAEPFASLDELEACWREALAKTAHLDGRGFDVLTDLRSARGRNDPEFERRMAVCRAPFYARFERSAVVVGTVVGKIHVQRLASDSERAPDRSRIFDDIDEARTWLTESQR